MKDGERREGLIKLNSSGAYLLHLWWVTLGSRMKSGELGTGCK